jgi:hypothetical protein
MKIPGFTAEVSLSEVRDNYAMALRHAEESGMVLPQAICYYCTPDGCYPVPCKIRPYA